MSPRHNPLFLNHKVRGFFREGDACFSVCSFGVPFTTSTYNTGAANTRSGADAGQRGTVNTSVWRGNLIKGDAPATGFGFISDIDAFGATHAGIQGASLVTATAARAVTLIG